MKKILALMVSIPLLLMSSFSSAAVALGSSGWIADGSLVAQKESAVLTATKDALKSSALITPAASDVGKVLIRGAGGYALTFAIEQLLGAVDWVMDPANNSIQYKLKSPTICSSADGSDCVSSPKLFGSTSYSVPYVYTSGESALFAIFTKVTGGLSALSYDSCNTYDFSNASSFSCIVHGLKDGSDWWSWVSVNAIENPNYNPAASEEKNLPIDTVAAKVISNANDNNTDAQTVTMAAANDILNAAGGDDEKAAPIIAQLENNSTNCTPQDFEDGTCKLKPTDHSKLRSAEGRPVGKVVNDIQKARDSDIFIQTNNNRFIVRGTNSREHIVTQNGEHITTVELRTAKQHNKLLNQGDRRFATQAEIDLLKSFIK